LAVAIALNRIGIYEAIIMHPNLHLAVLSAAALSSALPNLPVPSELLDWGLFAVTAVYFLRYLSEKATRASADSWELLRSLVSGLQVSNSTLAATNQELVTRLGEMQEMQQQLRQQLKEVAPYG
jgi:hypothetical protein